MSTPQSAGFSLTATDWQLYTHANGVDRVAQRLNEAVTRALQSATDKIEANEQVLDVMEAHAEWGAAEDGPACVLGDLLDSHFDR